MMDSVEITTDNEELATALVDAFHSARPVQVGPVTVIGQDMDITYGGPTQVSVRAMVARYAEWNGKGIPPKGTVCELRTKTGGWGEATIKYVGKGIVVWLWARRDGNTDQIEFAECPDKLEFRKLRTHEERERDAAIDKMAAIATADRYDLGQLYDAGLRFVDED